MSVRSDQKKKLNEALIFNAASVVNTKSYICRKTNSSMHVSIQSTAQGPGHVACLKIFDILPLARTLTADRSKNPPFEANRADSKWNHESTSTFTSLLLVVCLTLSPSDAINLCYDMIDARDDAKKRSRSTSLGDSPKKAWKLL